MSAADAFTWHKSACKPCDINCAIELGVSGDGAAHCQEWPDSLWPDGIGRQLCAAVTVVLPGLTA